MLLPMRPLLLAPLLAAVLAFAACGSVPDRLADELDEGDCGASVIDPSQAPVLEAWTRASETASIECGQASPGLLYAKFASHADLRADLLGRPPSTATCIVGAEVVLDGLFDDPGRFGELCGELDGELVDAVSGLKMPDDPTGSIAGAERAAAEYDRLAARAQARALREHLKG